MDWLLATTFAIEKEQPLASFSLFFKKLTQAKKNDLFEKNKNWHTG